MSALASSKRSNGPLPADSRILLQEFNKGVPAFQKLRPSSAKTKALAGS
jgi:hypothetical protein